MSEDSGSKTEPPTPRRLRQARERGQVPRSQDVNTVAVLLALLAVGIIWAEGAHQQLQEIMRLATRPLPALEDRVAVLFERMWGILAHGALCVAPFVAAMTVVALATGWQQTGMLLAPKSLVPDFDRANPVSGFKRLFSEESLFNLGKTILKFVLLIVMLAVLVRGQLVQIFMLPYADPHAILGAIGQLFALFIASLLLPLALLAVGDYAFQRYLHFKRQRMTKDEVRRDHKETEGDPETRGRRRAAARELATSNPVDRARYATIVLHGRGENTVALYWNPRSDAPPWVLCKEAGPAGRAVRLAALSARAILVHDASLTRVVFEGAEIGADLTPALAARVVKAAGARAASQPANG
jgi:flagellar biosynthesis protein FlhB